MKAKYLLPIFIILLTVSSCKKYLAVDPTDFTTPETFFESPKDLDQALTGIYSILNNTGTYSRNLVFDLAFGTDEAFYKRSTAQVDPIVYNADGSNSTITATWSSLYEGINNANLLLENINRPVMDETERGRIRGEALFLRAFLYFQLVHLWGDVPLILKPTKSGIYVKNARTPQTKVYDQILGDMIIAEGLVNAGIGKDGSGRVTKAAVWGILSRVCLKMAGAPLNDVAKFEDAKMWADKVIQSGVHSLNPNYAQVFINLTQDKYDIAECIWEVEIAGNGIGNPLQTGGWFAKKLSVRNQSGPLYGYAEVGATGILYRRYDDPHDVRRDRNIATYYFPDIKSESLNDTLPHPATAIYIRDTGKWRIQEEISGSRNSNAGPTNFPLLRYADVLLMYAEAENEINGPTAAAFTALNQVRARAKARDFTPSDASDKDSFRRIIQDERSRELCYEATRKFDLIRWGIFIGVMKDVENDILSNAPTNLQYGATGYTNVKARNLLLPIPTIELNLNSLMRQNPGY
ncbi:RagB/SusD family nutrient uptake outer membrane protein [Pedobacter psychroterrae]|uniref:RagB/SusD family nutrient uptake outer membrane protein n=1 Tax=Pedobacter psychroterrae TaxID=2530453 RepID=A0A4R0ND66_9SPHI|nr:RagB/SusD family nutrient uptake outer membrane protein [Pedobacter psychroterrae]TCC98205.1 RagB/SusD family nutrient uptake outer membrane protein [Pedobacter psychroterrae]